MLLLFLKLSPVYLLESLTGTTGRKRSARFVTAGYRLLPGLDVPGVLPDQLGLQLLSPADHQVQEVLVVVRVELVQPPPLSRVVRQVVEEGGRVLLPQSHTVKVLVGGQNVSLRVEVSLIVAPPESVNLPELLTGGALDIDDLLPGAGHVLHQGPRLVVAVKPQPVQQVGGETGQP